MLLHLHVPVPQPTPGTPIHVPEEAPPLIYWNRGYRKLHLHEEAKP